MKTMINLTQHWTSAEQSEAGVVDVENKERLKELLTFNDIPSEEEVSQRADAIIREFVDGHISPETHDAMVGGAGFFIPVLAYKLKEIGFNVFHAFTRRDVVERQDGTKMAVFNHLGFAPDPVNYL